MTTGQTSRELLSHFDRPKAIDCPDFEWVEQADEAARGLFVAEEVAQARWGLADARPQPPGSVRGVQWVLQWAAALAVLTIGATVLAEFAYLVAAENALNVAARAGAVEATLPRATYYTIAATVERRLAGYPRLNGQLQVSLSQNGTPVDRQFRARGGDRLSIIVTAPASSVVPAWLSKLRLWGGDAPIDARAQSAVPGRKVKPRLGSLSQNRSQKVCATACIQPFIISLENSTARQ